MSAFCRSCASPFTNWNGWVNHTRRVHPGPDLAVRLLWGRVDRSYECWNWVAGVDAYGYGQLVLATRKVKAHRLAYELWVGPIPAGMFVIHSCDNRRCVRPAHLRVGTAADNARDMVERGRALTGDRSPSRRPEHRARVRGSGNPQAKLTEADVAVIRERLTTGDPVEAIASSVSVSPTAIKDIRDGRSWRYPSTRKRAAERRLPTWIVGGTPA